MNNTHSHAGMFTAQRGAGRLHACAAAPAGLLILLAHAGCTLESSPVSRASEPKVKAASWQPTPVTQLDSGSDAGASERSPRVANAGGAKATSDGRDAGATRTDPGDAAVDVVSPRDAGAALHDAAMPVVSTTPAEPTMEPAMVPMMDAASAMAEADASNDSASEPSDCQPGMYTGDFEGTLEAAGIPVSRVRGPIGAQLTVDDSGLYLNITELRVVGRDASGNILRVTMTGKINCKTLELEAGKLEDGRYYLAERRTTLSFDGEVQGVYTVSPYAVNGTWTVSARAASLLAGEGTFTFALQE